MTASQTHAMVKGHALMASMYIRATVTQGTRACDAKQKPIIVPTVARRVTVWDHRPTSLATATHDMTATGARTILMTVS